MYQYGRYRCKYLAQDVDDRSGKAAESQRLLCRIDFRHYLSEKQQQKSEDDCQYQKLCENRMKNKNIHKKEVTEHDDGHIHKIVCDKNGCQQTFGICKQIADLSIRRVITLLYIIQIRR